LVLFGFRRTLYRFITVTVREAKRTTMGTERTTRRLAIAAVVGVLVLLDFQPPEIAANKAYTPPASTVTTERAVDEGSAAQPDTGQRQDRSQRQTAVSAPVPTKSAAAERPGTLTTNAPPPATVNDQILRWTFHLQDVLRRADGGPTIMSRNAAAMYLAAYDAVNSITPVGQPYRRQFADGPRCTAMPAAQRQQCLDAAVTAASAGVLEQTFPGQASFVQNARAVEDSRTGTGLAADIGRVIGGQAASELLNARANDNSQNTTAYTFENVPGAWRLTGANCTAPVDPHWPSVRPFAIPSGSAFRPPRPGGFATYAALLPSSIYAQNVNEVQSLGRFNSTTRTAEQTQIAFFWANELPGTYHPPGQHFDHTRIVSQQRGLTLQQNARLFGLVATALADAAIVAWDSKFATAIDLWRPETAIQQAATDNNPATNADPAWEPLSVLPDGQRFSPCFPAYSSGHATFGGAWAAVMRLFFGTDNIAFTGTTDDPNAAGVTRQFPGFTAAAIEDARSRIYLGVHYQFDADFGRASGNATGEFVVNNVLRPL
jgi:membrane-associated phospholipid phosphatase